MPTLTEQFAPPKKRSAVIAALTTLVDSEVSKKGGFSGLAIKGTYAVVKAIKPSFITEAITGMFDDCVTRLEPIYAECAGAGAATFHTRWTGKGGAVADALLAITDQRAQNTRHAAAKKGYEKLRPSAKRNVEEAVPALGQVLARHAAV